MKSKIDEFFDRVALNAQDNRPADPAGHKCPAVGARISLEDCRKHQLMLAGVCDRCNYKSINA